MFRTKFSLIFPNLLPRKIKISPIKNYCKSIKTARVLARKFKNSFNNLEIKNLRNKDMQKFRNSQYVVLTCDDAMILLC